MNNDISSLRYEYAHASLTEKDASPNAILQFEKWWGDVMKAEIFEANAMVLATASADGLPSARVVLLKEFGAEGFIFYTNYNSYKGAQLEENPKACLVFFWKELERQVRITGIVSKLEDGRNDAYFYSRPVASQAGAVASPQSQVLADKEVLQKEYYRVLEQSEQNPVKRPSHWGGYLVQPAIIEFWQGRPGRLHDRLQYTLQQDGNWMIERLAP